MAFEGAISAEFAQKIIALPLGTTRWLVIISIMPLFSMLATQGMIRLATAFTLSFPLVTSLVSQAPDFDFGYGTLALLMLKEALIGALLGVLFGVPFWAVQAAGDIFDNVKGEAQGAVADPRGSDEMLLSGRFLSMLYVTYMLTSGGFLILIGIVYDSFELWPVTTLLPTLSVASLDPFLSVIQRILLLALIVGGPLIFMIFAIDIMVSFMARTAPNMEALTLGFALKALIGAMVLIAYMAIIPDMFAIASSYYEEIIVSLKDLLHGR